MVAIAIVAEVRVTSGGGAVVMVPTGVTMRVVTSDARRLDDAHVESLARMLRHHAKSVTGRQSTQTHPTHLGIDCTSPVSGASDTKNSQTIDSPEHDTHDGQKSI